MKISVKIKPNAKEESISITENNEYIVKVKAPATEGRANERLIELLSEHFKSPKRYISIIKGFKSKNKIIDIG